MLCYDAEMIHGREMSQDEQLAREEQREAELSICPRDSAGLEAFLQGSALEFPCSGN